VGCDRMAVKSEKRKKADGKPKKEVLVKKNEGG
jgi:hypothetical protein